MSENCAGSNHCIPGSIIEAFYGILAVLIAECRSRIDEFEHVLGRDRNADLDDKEK